MSEDLTDSWVLCDAHAHFCGCYDQAAAFGALLRLWPLPDPTRTAAKVVRIACLAESGSGNFFRQLPDLPARPGLFDRIEFGRENGCAVVMRADRPLVYLMAGRQIVTRERLEVLGLLMNAEVPNGLELAETIQRVRVFGGVPVLPWGLGKWWGLRGRLVRRLLAGAQPGDFCLGDTALRFAGVLDAGLFRLARARKLPVLPGSDPLPLPGEELFLASFGAAYRVGFDEQTPLASLRQIWNKSVGCPELWGARCGWWRAAHRSARLFSQSAANLTPEVS